MLAFRGGRQDALSAGPAGVPEPHQDLNSHIESFRRQGFTQSEMIGLVACGHTIGGVRSQDFPEIVPPTNPDVLEGVFDLFDTTRDFDNKVYVKVRLRTCDQSRLDHVSVLQSIWTIRLIIRWYNIQTRRLPLICEFFQVIRMQRCKGEIRSLSIT